MIIKAFLLFIALLVIGGFGYFAVSDPVIQQSQIKKTMSLEDIEAIQKSNAVHPVSEQTN